MSEQDCFDRLKERGWNPEKNQDGSYTIWVNETGFYPIKDLIELEKFIISEASKLKLFIR